MHLLGIKLSHSKILNFNKKVIASKNLLFFHIVFFSFEKRFHKRLQSYSKFGFVMLLSNLSFAPTSFGPRTTALLVQKLVHIASRTRR